MDFERMVAERRLSLLLTSERQGHLQRRKAANKNERVDSTEYINVHGRCESLCRRSVRGDGTEMRDNYAGVLLITVVKARRTKGMSHNVCVEGKWGHSVLHHLKAVYGE